MKRNSGPRKLLRLLRAQRQRQRFEAFLDAELPAARAAGYSEQTLRTRIAERARARRDWSGRPPRVVAFGTREWEQYGLWPAFEALTEFDYWEYREPFTHPPRMDAGWRQRLADGFLAHVRERRRTHEVDVAFFYASAQHISLELLAQLHALGIWTVVMGLDDKHQFLPGAGERTAAQLELAAACDLYMTTWWAGAAIAWAHGGRPWCTAEGADPQYHRPLPATRDLDAVFIGQAYGRRGDLVRYLRRHGLEVGAYGAGWPDGFVSFEDQVTLYSRARVVLGYGGVRLMREVQHLKGRDFEVPMCRALYLTTYNPELAAHFDIGREILCYTSFQECREQIEWVLAHPAEADAMRAAAYQRARRDHTWQARLTALLGLLSRDEAAP